MQNSGNRRHESLLLQPGSLKTWDDTSGSVFMPLAVESHDANVLCKEDNKEEPQYVFQANRANEPLFAPSTSTEKYISDSRSISQLQQPLMPCKATVSNASAIASTSVLQNSGGIDEQSVNIVHPPATVYAQFPSQQIYLNSTVTANQQCVPCSGKGNLTANFPDPGSVIPSCDNSEKEGLIPANHQVLPENNPFAKTDNIYSEVFVCQPVKPYWFYKEIIEQKELWYGFSPLDSEAIEKAYQHALEYDIYDETTVVPVVGGRYDVYVQQREKVALYWSEKITSVRRCTWFYKVEGSQRFIPYDEAAAYSIEEMYQKCAASGQWHQKVLLNGGEFIMIEGPLNIYHCAPGVDVWPTIVDVKTTPKVAIRGVPDGVVSLPNETLQIDHLVFVVQGIGSFCDLSFRTVYQCVDGFREIANSLIPTHFKSEYENKIVGRVEFLPLAWHSSLHTDDVGFDRKMKSITLPSIPKLRYFTNDTLLDILLYSSPMYCQAIIDTVTSNLNRLYYLFLSRNPQFVGQVSVAGHSLGSLILFDILSNQTIPQSRSLENLGDNELHDVNLSNFNSSRRSSLESESSSDAKKQTATTIESIFTTLGLQEYLEIFLKEKMDLESLMFCGEDELKDLGLPMGPRKKLLAFMKTHKKQDLLVKTVELADGTTGSQTSEAVPSHSMPYFSPAVFPSKSPYNALSSVKFPRLEFNPACFFALGSPIAMFLAVRGYTTISEDYCFPTCPSFFHIFHPYDPVAFRIEPLIDPKFAAKAVLIPHHKGRKRMHLEIRENIVKMGSELKQRLFETLKFTWNHINLFTKGGNISSEAVEAEVDKLVQEQIRSQIDEDYQEFSENVFIGKLNRGRRIDYVLQEKPIEALNEYIFALTSHATYWNSEDTLLMILKEVYAVQGILPKPNESKDNIAQDIPVSYQHSFPTSFLNAQDSTEVKSCITSKEAVFEDKIQTSGFSHSPLVNPCNSASELLYPVGSAATYNLSENSFPASQSLGPPPLSGFIKKSPFIKH